MNLKVIGKAVTLSEAVARSDRGPFPKLREVLQSAKVSRAAEDIVRAYGDRNQEGEESLAEAEPRKPWWYYLKDTETPEQRRVKHLSDGTVSFFSGVGLMIFLYYLTAALVLKIPPDVAAKIPFELEPVIRVAWLFGLVPTLSGVGHIIAYLLIAPPPRPGVEAPTEPRPVALPSVAPEQRGNITDHTTELLELKVPSRQTNEIAE